MSGSLYLIDSFSLIFQVYHAIPPMTGPTGLPTNATYGFTRDLLTILKDKRPTHLICAMDSEGPGTRNELYAQYKANRDEMPEDLRSQIPMIIDVIHGFEVPAIGYAGWEADDVIATITRQAVERGLEVSIVTGDKDARQLLGPSVRIYNVRKNVFLGETELEQDWGIRPDQVIDFQALVGDSVDNVPGVPLVGPKKAKALLAEFGNLDEVLQNSDQAKGPKLRENLSKFADQARMSRELVTLNTELPLELDWEAARVAAPDQRRLQELFRNLGFRRFTDEVDDLAAKQRPAKPSQSTLFPERTQTWDVVDSSEKLRDFLAALSQQTSFCVDLETTGLDAVRADIVGWAFSWQSDTGYYLPVQGPPGQSTLDGQAVVDQLRSIFEDPAIEITNQNIKYDMLVLRRAGIRLNGVGIDPMVGHYLLYAAERSHGLDALAEKYLNHRMIPISDLIGTGRNQGSMSDVDIDRVAEYAVEDASISWQLAGVIRDELERESLWDLYWDLERPLISVLADMEYRGIRVDVAELDRQSAELSERLEQLVERIHDEAGREFNIDSPKQLQQVLFDELGLPPLKKIKTGASTDQSVLERLAALHPLPRLVIEHRQLSKLKGTYLDALPALVNPETGRIHTSFNQVVAATGRLSSTNPNLQNIPIRTEEGRRVRRAFVPGGDDWCLVCADYSQIELRMLAHFSGDPALRAAFAVGADVHATVAAEIFEVDAADVDSDKRRIAKAVNFGVIYGQGAFGLAQAVGISQPAAAEFIDDYFERYSGISRFLDSVLDECAISGYATTMLGRRRAIQGIRGRRPRQRNMPERTAINTVIQGSAADLIKRAMINVHQRIQSDRHPGRMLLQIHDELVFEVPQDHAASLIELVRDEMESAFDLSVPLTVDVSVGQNWLEVEPLHNAGDSD